MPTDAPILHVGDTVRIGNLGRAKIERIDICLRPSTDPAAEQHFANVEEVELGEHGPQFVVGVQGGTWAYGVQVVEGSIEEAV